MKKTLLSILGCLIAVSSYSQDKLYTHKGDTLNVYIKEVNENSIKFIYPHHTGRMIFELRNRGLVKLRPLNFEARYLSAIRAFEAIPAEIPPEDS